MTGVLKSLSCCISPPPEELMIEVDDDQHDDTDNPLKLNRPLNLNCESDRLKTFEKWQHKYIDKFRLAKTGFYYFGKADIVTCQFCNVSIGRWLETDDEITEHLKWSTHCPLLRGFTTGNLPIDQTSSLAKLLENIDRDEVD